MYKVIIYTFFILAYSSTYSQVSTPTAFYPFNGSAKDSIGTKDGTVSGATLTADRFGNANSAYNFDGTNDFIDLPSDFDYPQRTYDLWFRLDDITKFPQTILACDHAALVNGLSNMEIDKYSLNTVQIAMALGSNVGIQAVNQGVWYRATMTSDGSTTRFYINGSLIYTGNASTTSKSADGQTNARLGTSRKGIKNFAGAIDDVTIYNKALTQSEISTLTGMAELNRLKETNIIFNQDINIVEVNLSNIDDVTGITLSVFDMSGKEVAVKSQLSSDKNQIDVSGLTTGTYISVLRTLTGEQKVLKFTKK